MKSSKRDKAEGEIQSAKGKVERKTGDVTDNDDLKSKGKRDQVEGESKKALGKVKETFES